MSDHTIVVFWVIKTYLYSSSVYSCHLFLISFASVKFLPFLFFIVPILVWNVPLISPIFLKRCLVFPMLLISLYFFALFVEKGFVISLCYSLELCIQLGISFPFSLLFASLLSSAICKALLDNYFAFLCFFCLGCFWSLPPVQHYEPLSIVLQAICLPDLIPCIYSSPPWYNHKGFDLGCTWMA